MDQKANLPKQSSHWEEMLQLGRPFMACVVARSRQIEKKKKNKKRTNEKLIVMSCTWKIRLSLNENQKAKKCWENEKITVSNYSSV